MWCIRTARVAGAFARHADQVAVAHTLQRIARNHHDAVLHDDLGRSHAELLSAALDDAWKSVEANKTAFKVDENADGARQALAKQIVDMAKR